MGGTYYRRDVGGWQVRWNDPFAARMIDEGRWPNRTLADYARQRASEDPGRIMWIDGDDGFSADALYQHARRLAGWFAAIGLSPGDVISFQLPNWWETAVINIAAVISGVVVNPIVPINRDTEVTYMLGAAHSKVMFVPELFRGYDYLAMMRRVADRLDPPPRIVCVRGGEGGKVDRLDDLLAASTPVDRHADVDPNAVKLLMYTSGTTGRPKAVLHSHNTINADSVMMKATNALGPDDMIFSPSPLTHISGYLWAINIPWYANVPIGSMDIWKPERAFDLMQKNRSTLSLGATPFLQDLVAVAKARGETLERLRVYICGGTSVPPALMHEAARIFPNCVAYRVFGATETATITCGPLSPEEIPLGADTDGKIAGFDLKVVDIATGALVAPGEEGEILARGASMALGYADMSDNDDAYDEDGYFRMGDLVRIVNGDHLLCTGRKKDLIIRAGENISAKEIEDVLFQSTAIAEVAVVSMPSKRTGEAICAFVIPADTTEVDIAFVSRLIDQAGLARQKTPEYVHIVAELPKTPAGKVRKDILRETARTFNAD